MNPSSQENEAISVRNLHPKDLEAVTALDAKIIGRRRSEYFKTKLAQALHETGVRVSLAAELDGRFAGFLICRVWYGEFGEMEPFAVLDTFGVHPDLARHGVARTLLRQLRVNLQGLGIQQVRTEVAWDSIELMTFFQHVGFRPAARLCLDLDLRVAAKREEREAAV